MATRKGLVAVIGDEDTVTGFLLTGIGHRDKDGRVNFLVCDEKVTIDELEKTFREFTTRKDISIILINQVIAEKIRYLIKVYNKTIPTILEIPSKNQKYDESKDEIMQRVL